jgi:hypothetical protein
MPFSTAFIAKLQSAGVVAEAQKGSMFSSQGALDLGTACKYATDNRYCFHCWGCD